MPIYTLVSIAVRIREGAEGNEEIGGGEDGWEGGENKGRDIPRRFVLGRAGRR